MITQAIKRWLHRMFAWWPWKTSPETVYVPVANSLNRGIAQDGRNVHDTMSWSTSEGVAPQTGVTPLIFGQGEISRSTIGEWPERVVQPSSSSPHTNEKAEPPSPLLPTSPPAEKAIDPGISGINSTPIPEKAVFSDIPSTPTAEQQLEFLSYLVRRGLVNEGFPEGQIPEQYRKK